jgi:hypothetical protein
MAERGMLSGDAGLWMEMQYRCSHLLAVRIAISKQRGVCELKRGGRSIKWIAVGGGEG